MSEKLKPALLIKRKVEPAVAVRLRHDYGGALPLSDNSSRLFNKDMYLVTFEGGSQTLMTEKELLEGYDIISELVDYDIK